VFLKIKKNIHSIKNIKNMIFIRKIENIKYVLNNYGKCTVYQPLASFVIQFSAANIA